jgi:hypothetical protein
VHEQQGGHHREGRPDEDGARVATPPSPEGEHHACSRRDQGRGDHGPEVSLAREQHVLGAYEVDERRRNDGDESAAYEQKRKAVTPHARLIGIGWTVR